MKERSLGGLNVSAIALGAPLYGDAPESEVVALIHRAIALGIRLVDTSDAYSGGENERVVGRALKGRRNEVVLSTKFGNIRDADGKPDADGRPSYVAEACDRSLARLGVDYVDLYYIHRIDPKVPIEDTVGAMVRLKEQGKIGHIGISEASPATLRRAHAVHPVTALQTEYSLWSREPEDELLSLCAELGVGFAAYSPLGRGFLTATIASDTALATNDLRRRHPRFQAENLKRNQALLEPLRACAQAEGCTAAQLALAWLLSRGDFIVPIVGTKRQKWLEENAAAVHLTPSPETLARLDQEFARGAVAGDRYPPALLARLNL
jgi:aryl-alcohol dehydrogenase-like predicted oxidoreductase